MMSASLRPARLSMAMIAPSGRNSSSDCRRPRRGFQPTGTARACGRGSAPPAGAATRHASARRPATPRRAGPGTSPSTARRGRRRRSVPGRRRGLDALLLSRPRPARSTDRSPAWAAGSSRDSGWGSDPADPGTSSRVVPPVGTVRRRRHLQERDLADVHARVQRDRQGGDVGQLERDVAVEPGVDEARRRVDQQAEAPEARLALQPADEVVGEPMRS